MQSVIEAVSVEYGPSCFEIVLQFKEPSKAVRIDAGNHLSPMNFLSACLRRLAGAAVTALTHRKGANSPFADFGLSTIPHGLHVSFEEARPCHEG